MSRSLLFFGIPKPYDANTPMRKRLDTLVLALMLTATGFPCSLLAAGSPTTQKAQIQNESKGPDGAMSAIVSHVLMGDDSMQEPEPDLYAKNLAFIRASSVRNRNHDNSLYRNTPSEDLILENLYGPRSEYLNNPGGNPEQSFPTVNGGQNRTACEFSHFAYDDPLVHPNKPGAAHLHMFFGNTDVNAFSSYRTLIDSGSGTCNGQELNRTGYWVPAMFDGNGNVRIPERIVVYYKGEGLARDNAEVYPEGAAMIASQNINAVSNSQGGAQGKFSFVCSNQYSGPSEPASNTMPICDGDRFVQPTQEYSVLEMNVKFPQCWNRQDASNIDNWLLPTRGGWYDSDCPPWATLPNLEYFVNYKVEAGETTEGWYLSSDVNMQDYTRTGSGGKSIHGDWWGGWNKEINQIWIDNCVKLRVEDEASGCGFGYLTNGGPDNQNPIPGPALKIRPQYTGPSKVPAETLFNELCETDRQFTKDEDAAFCKPMMHDM